MSSVPGLFSEYFVDSLSWEFASMVIAIFFLTVAMLGGFVSMADSYSHSQPVSGFITAFASVLLGVLGLFAYSGLVNDTSAKVGEIALSDEVTQACMETVGDAMGEQQERTDLPDDDLTRVVRNTAAVESYIFLSKNYVRAYGGDRVDNVVRVRIGSHNQSVVGLGVGYYFDCYPLLDDDIRVLIEDSYVLDDTNALPSRQVGKRVV